MTRRTPGATYRLQFHAGFTFDDALEVLPYLDSLGVTDIYASPILKARAGSSHGYDITNHNAINPELGGPEGLRRLSAALRERGMGLIMDFVPNHMGIGQADNAWWLDVLEWGPTSPFSTYFDIDWNPSKQKLKDKVLVPMLGDHYGAVLEAGQLKLAFQADEGSFSVWYWEHRFPVTPALYAPILTAALEEVTDGDGLSDERLAEMEILTAGFRELRRRPRAKRGLSVRRAKGASLKERLATLVAASPELLALIERAVERFNGTPGKPETFRALHRLLEEQHYRLSFWRVASDEINYRRFFQINDLAGLRVEEPDVFDAIHRLTLELIAEGTVTGLRIDHIDGLFAPRRYLRRLQEKVATTVPQTNDAGDPFYVVVEKILGTHESLREGWPVAGTTGYDFMAQVNGLLVDPAGERALNRLYRRILSGVPSFDGVIYDSKRQVMNQELAAELRVLANEMERVLDQDWYTRDFTTSNLHTALREVVACFPVYRTYVNRTGASPEDLRDIDWAIARARRMRTTPDPSVYDVVRALLTTEYARTKGRRRLLDEVVRLARKFQQYTGPVTAKGVEDTAFYRYNRLVSLNEVGGHPANFGHSVTAFHRHNQERARYTPAGLLATATHDHKRGEDTRARIDAISEFAAEWSRRVLRWYTLNRRARRSVDGNPVPHPNDEYLFYQTLVGVWPVDVPAGELPPREVMEPLRDRLTAYMIKALREAKLRTSWTSPDTDYEQAMESFVGRVLETSRPNPFLNDFAAFHAMLAPAGMLNGLSQVVLKHVCPGVPDTYQGTELWDDSLVDPDNRRPVDFDRRRRHLARLREANDPGTTPELAADLLARWPDGAIKLHVVHTLLQMRRRMPAVFRAGSYLPLDTEGRYADSLVALARAFEDRWLVAAVPRLTVRLRTDAASWPLGEDVWAKTRAALPENAPVEWRNVLTGERTQSRDGMLHAADLFTTLPVAVLVPES